MKSKLAAYTFSLFTGVAAAQAAPLDRQNLIPIWNDLPKTTENLVNFNYIARTGRIPDWSGPHASRSAYFFDFSRHDALTERMQSIEQSTIDALQSLKTSDPAFGALMDKPRWSKTDRERYEGTLAGIVTEKLQETPGLHRYRTIEVQNNRIVGPVQNIHRLNDLSRDIVNNTETLRFDCGVMSAIDGTIMQRVENRILPAAGTAPDDYKKASSYFFSPAAAYSMSYINVGLDRRGRPSFQSFLSSYEHAFIFTPTGNAVESTIFWDPYERSIQGNSLEQFVRGRPEVVPGIFYDIHSMSPGHIEDMLHSFASMIDSPLLSPTGILNGDALLARNGQNGLTVAKTKNSSFILVQQAHPGGSSTLSLLQRENRGMPDDGYVVVAQAPADGRTLHYKDAFTGNAYSFRLDPAGAVAMTETQPAVRPAPTAPVLY